MSERSPFWQAVNALFLAVITLAIVLFSAWFAHYADAVLGHGPNPSALAPGDAYIATILMVVFGLLPAAAAMMFVRQSKYFVPRFAWLVYALVCIPLAALLFVPLQRFGTETFMGLPSFLASVPGRAVIAVTLGGLLFAGTDMSRVVPYVLNKIPKIRRSRKGGQAGGGAVKGLPGRFTPNAWRALSNMQQEAQRFEHAYMGTEHLLLGVLGDKGSLGVRVIVNLGGDPGDIRGQLEAVISRRGTLYTGAGGMTRRCQRVIEAAARFARTSGQQTVGTGHLLHALVEDTDDIAGQLLESAGVTAQRVAGELRHLGPEGGEHDEEPAAAR